MPMDPNNQFYSIVHHSTYGQIIGFKDTTYNHENISEPKIYLDPWGIFPVNWGCTQQSPPWSGYPMKCPHIPKLSHRNVGFSPS